MPGETVLIIEDNENNAMLLRDVLSSKGYRPTGVTNAEDGLAWARAHQPCLILMDIKLPGMDGHAARSELLSDSETKDIPVIAVTASVMPVDRSQYEKEGFDGVIEKPFRIPELLAEVERVLRSSRPPLAENQS